jgi:hypothetical protein
MDDDVNGGQPHRHGTNGRRKNCRAADGKWPEWKWTGKWPDGRNGREMMKRETAFSRQKMSPQPHLTRTTHPFSRIQQQVYDDDVDADSGINE